MELMAASMEDMDELESENKKLKEELVKKNEEIVKLRHGIHGLGLGRFPL